METWRAASQCWRHNLDWLLIRAIYTLPGEEPMSLVSASEVVLGAGLAREVEKTEGCLGRTAVSASSGKDSSRDALARSSLCKECL
jgi:hypothetical protein